MLNRAKQLLFILLYLSIAVPVQNILASSGTIIPNDYGSRVEKTIDRSNLSDIHILTDYVLAYEPTAIPNIGHPFGSIYLVCNASSPFSSCKNSPSSSGDPYSITVKFKERQSSATVSLNIYSHIQRIFPQSNGCSKLDGLLRGFTDDLPVRCIGSPDIFSQGTQLSLTLERQELKLIPSGGIWEGSIEVFSVVGTSRYRIAIDIILHVTDKNNIDVYFLPNNNTNVELKPTNFGDLTVASGVLNACLYDGYGANSYSYEVRFTDTTPNTPKDGKFRIHNTSVAPGNKNTLEYTIISQSLGYGSFTPIMHYSGRSSIFNGVSSRGYQTITTKLGNINCTPWTIKFETELYKPISILSGVYSGVVKLEFTPSTISP